MCNSLEAREKKFKKKVVDKVWEQGALNKLEE